MGPGAFWSYRASFCSLTAAHNLAATKNPVFLQTDRFNTWTTSFLEFWVFLLALAYLPDHSPWKRDNVGCYLGSPRIARDLNHRKQPRGLPYFLAHDGFPYSYLLGFPSTVSAKPAQAGTSFASITNWKQRKSALKETLSSWTHPAIGGACGFVVRFVRASCGSGSVLQVVNDLFCVHRAVWRVFHSLPITSWFLLKLRKVPQFFDRILQAIFYLKRLVACGIRNIICWYLELQFSGDNYLKKNSFVWFIKRTF